MMTCHGELTPDLDLEVQNLSHDEAIGVIRSLLEGGWISADTIRLAMRVQRRVDMVEGVGVEPHLALIRRPL